MNLTQNFTLEEMVFSAKAILHKIDNTPNAQQVNNIKRLCVEILQPIRERLGEALKVTSGFRTPMLNNFIHGSVTSQHLTGEAADIVCSDNRRLWNIICEMIITGEISVGQLIDEKNLSWIHISLPDSRHHNQILHL